MKKRKNEGMGAGENRGLDWVELSEKLGSDSGKPKTADPAGFNGPGSDAIVNETISQIVSEDYLKVDTSDMDGVREAVDSFYAYGKKPAKKKAAAPVNAPDPEQDIRRSVDEKIIIRSEELKKKRKGGAKTAEGQKGRPAHKKAAHAAEKGKKPAESVRTDDSFRHEKGLEKYRKMGILPTKKNGPSEFRKKAADWRYDDVPKAAVTDEAIEQELSEETFSDRIKMMSPVQWGAVAMAAVLLITSVMTTTVYADYRGQINKENAMAQLPSFYDDATMIAYDPESVENEDIEMEDAAASPDSVEGKMLSLVLTSVEKDLKVKLVDEEDTLVKGVDWGITVTDKNEKESSYEDEDKDGIIHLTGISAGDYSVAITESDSLSGYVYPTVGQKVSVKAKVEYKVIANIKDEIKKESEVNAAAEDNGNKHADVESGPALTDTVEFVESTTVENETYVESSVDNSKTAFRQSASTKSRLISALGNFADSVTQLFSDNTVALIRVAPVGRMVASEIEHTDENTDSSSSSSSSSTEQPIEQTDDPTTSSSSEKTSSSSEKEKDTSSSSEKDTSSSSSSTEKPRPAEPEQDPYDPDAQLYDSDNNKLYVNDDGNYRLAKHSDEDDFYIFYKKTVEYIYTGWQNIDGRSYFYTKDHEKVTGDQVIGGVSYHFNSDGTLDAGSGVIGIDVSKYQPNINWSSVKASGIDFAIIRCGYRGSSTGALIEDPYFKSHIKGAKNAGLRVGVYFFSTALTEAEAVEEASMCAALCSGYGINYPVFLDVESSGRPGYNTLSASQRTANIQAFCKTIASAGYTPGLYANKTWLTEKINTSSLSCKIWLAQYRAEGPTYSGRYDIWQYTSKGRVDGVSGNVDMNKSFLKY